MANYILKLKNDGIDYTTNNNELLEYVEIGQNKKTILLNKEGTESIDLSLHKMSFHRKVYEPGLIDATIQISVDTSKNMPKIQKLLDLFMRKIVQLDVKTTNQNNEKITINIASEYYVHEIRPRYKTNKTNKTSMYVELKIYSIDNLMRINKFSEAYLGRKLREYIVKEGIKDYSFKGKTFYGKEKDNPYKIKLSDNDVLQNLSYGDVEFIQPYLVQYNETFYDFLARVCNRCGEFMYFENGELHVGLHLDKSATTKYKKLINLNEDKCNSIDYQNISEGVISVENYSHDSLKYEEFDNAGNLRNAPENNDESYNIKQINETGAYPETKTAEDGRPTKIYNDEVSNNEFFMPLYRDEFSGGWREQYFKNNIGEYIPLGLEALSCYDIVDASIHLLAGAGKIELKDLIKGDKAKEDGNEIIKTWAGTEKDKKGNDIPVKMGVPFADNERHRWTTLCYYSDIKNNEEIQEQKKVNVDMGDAFENLRLGDVVTLPYDEGNRYVVIEVGMDSETIDSESGNGESTTTYSSNMCFSAMPIIETTDTPPAWQSAKVNNVTTLEAKKMLKFFPPLLKTGAFRQSEPQHAIVIDSDDPKNQGRVRIRFTWQHYVDLNQITTSDITVSSIKSTIKVLKTVYEKVSAIPGKKENATDTEKKDRNDKIGNIKKDTNLSNEITNIETAKGKLDDPKTKSWKRDPEILNECKKNIKKIKEKIAKLSDDIDQKKINEIMADLKKEQNRLEKVLLKKNDADKEKEWILLEAGTPWIRMVTPMATKGGGMYFKPEKGDEVMVDFENGNVERPFVVGALYSKNVVAPMTPANEFAPGEHRIIKSPNGHHIKFEDATNLTTMLSFLPAFKFLKQWNIMPPKLDIGDSDSMINNLARNIMGGITIGDGLELCKINISGHDRKVTVQSTIGDVEISALSGITVSAPNGNIKIEGKNIDIAAGNRLTLTSGTNIYNKYKNPLSQGGIFSKDFWTNPSGGTSVESFTKHVVDEWGGGLIDMSAIRGFFEMIVKPVNGTLQIKSYSFLALEAGEGNAEIPVNNYSIKYLAYNNAPIAEKLHARGALTDNVNDEDKHMNTAKAVQALTFLFNEFKSQDYINNDAFVRAYNDACKKLAELHIKIGEDDKSIFKGDWDIIDNLTKDEFIEKCFDIDDPDTFLSHHTLSWHGGSPEGESERLVKDAYLAIRQMIRIAKLKEKEVGNDYFMSLHHEFGSVIKKLNEMTNPLNTIPDSTVFDNVKTGEAEAKKFDYYVNGEFAANSISFDYSRSWRYKILKLLSYPGGPTPIINEVEFFKKHGITVNMGVTIKVSELYDDSKWSAYINSLSINVKDPTGGQKFWNKGLKKYINDKALTFLPEKEVWAKDFKGKILMSDGTQTISFKKEGEDGVSLQSAPNIIDTKIETYTASLKKLLIESF